MAGLDAMHMVSKKETVTGKRMPPAAGMGRPKGAVNKTTKTLREAILAAAKAHGHDGSGKGGLEGYLLKVAAEDIKAFTSLLGRVLPLDVQSGGKTIQPQTIILKAAGDDGDD